MSTVRGNHNRRKIARRSLSRSYLSNSPTAENCSVIDLATGDVADPVRAVTSPRWSCDNAGNRAISERSPRSQSSSFSFEDSPHLRNGRQKRNCGHSTKVGAFVPSKRQTGQRDVYDSQTYGRGFSCARNDLRRMDAESSGRYSDSDSSVDSDELVEVLGDTVGHRDVGDGAKMECVTKVTESVSTQVEERSKLHEAEIQRRVEAEIQRRVEAEVQRRVEAEVQRRVEAEVQRRVEAEVQKAADAIVQSDLFQKKVEERLMVLRAALEVEMRREIEDNKRQIIDTFKREEMEKKRNTLRVDEILAENELKIKQQQLRLAEEQATLNEERLLELQKKQMQIQEETRRRREAEYTAGAQPVLATKSKKTKMQFKIAKL